MMVETLAVKMDASLAVHSAGWMDALTVVAKVARWAECWAVESVAG